MTTNPSTSAEQIVNLNVGGHRFATSRHTLTWISDSFFTRLKFKIFANNEYVYKVEPRF